MGPSSEQKKCCGDQCCNPAPAESQAAELNTSFKPTESPSQAAVGPDTATPAVAQTAQGRVTLGRAVGQMLDGFSQSIMGRFDTTKERLIALGSLAAVYPLTSIPEVGGIFAAAGLLYGAAKVLQPIMRSDAARPEMGESIGHLLLTGTGLGGALLVRDILNRDLIWSRKPQDKAS